MYREPTGVIETLFHSVRGMYGGMRERERETERDRERDRERRREGLQQLV